MTKQSEKGSSVSRHTPIPWKAEPTTETTQALLRIAGKTGESTDIEIWDARGDCIGVVGNMKTAKKIVRCVNSHQALLDELNEQKTYMEQQVFVPGFNADKRAPLARVRYLKLCEAIRLAETERV